jgi:hypothetical protein
VYLHVVHTSTPRLPRACMLRAMKHGGDPSSGDLDGLAAFLDQMAKEGHVNQATAKAHKTATRKVVAAGEAAGLGPIDFRTADVEPYAEAFERDKAGDYTPRSIANYVSRFRSATTMYAAFLDDPSWRPTAKSTASTPSQGTVVTYVPMPGYTAELPLPPRISATELSALLASLVREA